MEGRGGNNGGLELELPGFRFHPTEEELLDFYLSRVANGKRLNPDIIGMLNIYRYDPWELPGMARIGEREWYFFVRRDRKAGGNGGRPNRTTERGFWKATGSDRAIRSAAEPRRLIGLKKTLVFYKGRAPRGTKTDWIMNEYRLPEHDPSRCTISSPKEDVVLCKIYRKATSLKELEHRAAMEEAQRAAMDEVCFSIGDNLSSDDQEILQASSTLSNGHDLNEKTEDLVKRESEVTSESTVSTSVRSVHKLPELQVSNFGFDWMQDPLFPLLRSPWMDQWSPYANILNF